mmetsp:Transcript_55464/g.109964  ORF Transcript_55464/g.109964 Transcript_55464/m.109964 type:complete len:404 (+) Transcript_55464:166-1377(+)
MPVDLWLLVFLLGVVDSGLALIGRIISPCDDCEYYQHNTMLYADISIDDTSNEKITVCWTLLNRLIDQTVEGCWPYSEHEGWNGTKVPLHNRGQYTLTLGIYSESHETSAEKGPLLSKDSSSFKFTIHPNCRQAIRDRAFKQDKFYNKMQMGGGDDGDDEAESWVTFELAPLCYDEWPKTTNHDFLTSNMLITASNRGMFGVDYSMQQFGMGDRSMLDWVLDKHRSAFVSHPNIVEMGTFGGVTALYLGMAAGLRGGRLDTFDVGDFRSVAVVKNWLPNMKFHLGNANLLPEYSPSGVLVSNQGDSSELTVATGDVAAELIRECSLVLVDHADRLWFTRVIVAPNLRRGAVIVVHDFPPGGTTEEQWDHELGLLGLSRRYASVQGAFESRLATFVHSDLPGRI